MSDRSVQLTPLLLDIPQLSISTEPRNPAEVTIRFLRFTRVGMTAYQKDQAAGFLRPEAAEIVASGRAVFV